MPPWSKRHRPRSPNARQRCQPNSLRRKRCCRRLLTGPWMSLDLQRHQLVDAIVVSHLDKSVCAGREGPLAVKLMPSWRPSLQAPGSISIRSPTTGTAPPLRVGEDPRIPVEIVRQRNGAGVSARHRSIASLRYFDKLPGRDRSDQERTSQLESRPRHHGAFPDSREESATYAGGGNVLDMSDLRDAGPG